MALAAGGDVVVGTEFLDYLLVIPEVRFPPKADITFEGRT